MHNLNYKFIINERYVHAKNDEGKYFECETPFLKILKPVHILLNKKKTIAKKYLILETNDDLDFNNQIGSFMYIINKIHEISQEKIRDNSLEWFNTEFDDIGLDIKVKRPIDQQKDSEFIKLSIPLTDNMENDILKLNKGEYVSCSIIFKGLKVTSDSITEDWEIKSLKTQLEEDIKLESEYICNSIVIDTDIDQETGPLLEQDVKLADPVLEQDVKLADPVLEQDVKLIDPVLEQDVKLIDPVLEQDVKDIKQMTQTEDLAINKTIKKIKSSTKGKLKEKNVEIIKKFNKKLLFT